MSHVYLGVLTDKTSRDTTGDIYRGFIVIREQCSGLNRLIWTESTGKFRSTTGQALDDAKELAMGHWLNPGGTMKIVGLEL